MSVIVKMTTNGTVSLPEDVRVVLGIAPGEDVEIAVLGDGAVRMSRPHPATAKPEPLEARLARLRYLQTGRDPDDIMRDIRGDDPFPP